jgi:hypothetical protein
VPVKNNNYFNVLTVEEIPDCFSVTKDTSDQNPKKLPRRPCWERRLPEKLEIDAAEPGSNSLYLRIEIESTETQRKQGI